MTRLTSKQRSKMPAKEFAGPGRSFPENNRAHDVAAIMDVGKAVRAGHITSSEAAEIKGRAERNLGRK